MSSQTWCWDQLLIPLFFLIEDHPRVIDYLRPQCWATEQEDGVFPWQRVLWIKTKKQKLRDDFKDSSRSTNMQPSWTLKWILRMFPPTSSCFLLQAPPPLTGVAYHSAVRHTDCGCRRSTLTVYYLDRCVVAFMLWWLGCYSDSQHVCLCAAFWLVETVQSCVCVCFQELWTVHTRASVCFTVSSILPPTSDTYTRRWSLKKRGGASCSPMG